jgi:SOS response associated peptidase (SRAP)
MCGRFTQHYTWSEVRDFLSLLGAARNLRPHYNIAPTTTVDVVRLDRRQGRHQPHGGCQRQALGTTSWTDIGSGTAPRLPLEPDDGGQDHLTGMGNMAAPPLRERCPQGRLRCVR